MHFSPSTKAFYVAEIHGSDMPNDVVEITPEKHAALLAAQSEGMVITADAQGQPVAQPPAPPSTEQLRAAATLDIERRRDEALSAGVAMGDAQFHSDNGFLIELLGMIMGYQAGVYTGTQAIRTKDNQIKQLDAASIIELASLVGAHRKAVYATSWAEKEAL